MINSKRRLKRFVSVISLAAQSSRDRKELEQSRLGMKVQNSDLQFAQSILDTAKTLNSVEDMVVFEQSLQDLDRLKAKSKADLSSIAAARKSYEKLAITIEQMRSNPAGYFQMNMGNKEYSGDPRRIIKSNSMDHITGNVTRMQNRRQFASESESKIWDARIAMAKKTGDMFTALHSRLAGDFERTQEKNAPA